MDRQAVDLDRVWRIFTRSNFEGEEAKLVDKIKALSTKYSPV
jgi:hypothetical protein